MTPVPAGSFVMGAAAGSEDMDALPPHTVTFAKPFAIGAHEVTRGEFARFVVASGHDAGGGCNLLVEREWKLVSEASWRSPGFVQTDAEPVVCVSWTDAQAYVVWLSREAGIQYRLPSEAEWEYAARAGSAGEYESPAGIDHDRANYGLEDCCGPLVAGHDRFEYTAPVGSFDPNAFGVYEIRGNVWEWLADCYHENYQGAPADGAARTSGCSLADRRGVRGGSWNDGPALLRASYRLRGPPDGRYFTLGFRVARDLGASVPLQP
jgi:formylglycine-generating enzyme required for sulfatase activity